MQLGAANREKSAPAPSAGSRPITSHRDLRRRRRDDDRVRRRRRCGPARATRHGRCPAPIHFLTPIIGAIFGGNLQHERSDDRLAAPRVDRERRRPGPGARAGRPPTRPSRPGHLRPGRDRGPGGVGARRRRLPDLRLQLDFGDGATTSGLDSAIAHDYRPPGTYTITLEVTNQGGNRRPRGRSPSRRRRPATLERALVATDSRRRAPPPPGLHTARRRTSPTRIGNPNKKVTFTDTSTPHGGLPDPRLVALGILR